MASSSEYSLPLMVPEIVVGYRQESRRHGVIGGKTLKLPSVRQASVKVVVYRERTYTAGQGAPCSGQELFFMDRIEAKWLAKRTGEPPIFGMPLPIFARSGD